MNILSDDGKTIVRLKSWAEVFSRPYFKKSVNPKQLKLKSILGDYDFGTLDKCGLSTCRTKHKRGFLVQCSGNVETNIGHKYGKRYFGVDFEEQQANFTRDMNARKFREAIELKIIEVPKYQKMIDNLLKHEGKEAFARMRDLDSNIFRGVINTKLKRRAVKGDGELVESIQASKTDIEREEVRLGIGLSQAEKERLVVNNTVGRIAGIRAFSEYKKLKIFLLQNSLNYYQNY